MDSDAGSSSEQQSSTATAGLTTQTSTPGEDVPMKEAVPERTVPDETVSQETVSERDSEGSLASLKSSEGAPPVQAAVSSGPSGIEEGHRSLEWLFGVTVAAIALLHVIDHAQWVALDRSPLISNDSPMHLENAASGYWWWKESPRLFPRLTPGVYPPLLYFVAYPLFEVFGLSSETFRLAQLPFTAALVIGVALMARRSFGRMAGISAAALATVFPQLWVQRTETQMDFPLAGMAALAFGLMPTPGKSRPVLALLGGLAMAGSLLTKQAMLAVAGGGLFVLNTMALWDIFVAWRKKERLPLTHLRDTVLYSSVAVGLSFRWYLASYPLIQDALSHIFAEHKIPTGLEGIIYRLGFLGWFKQGYLFAPIAWAVILGLLMLPWVLPRNRLLLVSLAGLVGGLYQFTTFPDPHERHFVVLLPMALLLSLSSFGLINRCFKTPPLGSVLRGLAALACVLYGTLFCVSWRFPTWGTKEERMVLGEADFGRLMPTSQLDKMVRMLLARPRAFVYFSPLPQRATWPLPEMVEQIRSLSRLETLKQVTPYLRRERVRSGPQVWILENIPPNNSFLAEGLMQGEPRIIFMGIQGHELKERLVEFANAGQPRPPLFVIIEEDPSRPPPLEQSSLSVYGFTLAGNYEGQRSWAHAKVALKLYHFGL